MSSYFTAAQLEEMRREQIRKELSDELKKLEDQLRAARSSTVSKTESADIRISVVAEDHAVSGCGVEIAVDSSALEKTDKSGAEEREALDLSGLLHAVRKKPGKLALALDAEIHKVDERPILSEKDLKDRARVLTEIDRIVKDPAMDMEDRLQTVRRRVTSYLKQGRVLSPDEKREMESLRDRYCVLCGLLGEKPREYLPDRVRGEVRRLTERLEERRKEEYIMDVLEKVLEELGFRAECNAVLENKHGMLFSVDGHPLCDLFVGKNGNGFLFEPVAAERDNSLETDRRIESSANSICAMYAQVERKAAEKGVNLKRVFMQPAQIANLHVQADIQGRTKKKKRRKLSGQEEKVMGLEG